MKRAIAILLSLSLIVAVLVLGSTRLGTSAIAQQPGEVVILRCAVSAPVSAIPLVMSSSGSAGAPIVARGATCAQGLADLINAGFQVQTLESAGTGDRTDLFYTLVSTR